MPVIDSGPGDDHRTLAARVTAVLADSGLPPDSLDSLSPASEQGPSQNTTFVRSRASLTLSPVTLPGLGRFLENWRRAQPAWSVTSIDLNPQRQAAGFVGDDLPLRVIITLETVTVREFTPQSGNNSVRPSKP